MEDSSLLNVKNFKFVLKKIIKDGFKDDFTESYTKYTYNLDLLFKDLYHINNKLNPQQEKHVLFLIFLLPINNF